MQEKKEHHLHKNTLEARLTEVKSARSSTFKRVNLTGNLHTLLVSSRKMKITADSEKTDRLKGLINALLGVNNEEDISEIDTVVEQLPLDGFGKKASHAQMS